MLFVDSKRALGKLVKVSLRQNRLRNAVAVSMVAVSFLVIFIGVFFAYDGILGYKYQQYDQYSSATHVLYQAEDKQIEQLRVMNSVEKAGKRIYVTSGADEWEDLFLYHSDEEDFEMVKEIALESIGMTRKSLKNMLVAEGAIYGIAVGITAGITLLFTAIPRFLYDWLHGESVSIRIRKIESF